MPVTAHEGKQQLMVPGGQFLLKCSAANQALLLSPQSSAHSPYFT